MKLSDRDWKEFFLEDIFSVGSGKRLTNADKIDGTRPFIGATDNMNGVTGFVDNENSSLDNNVLGVNYNGAPCIGFYHPYWSVMGNDCRKIHISKADENMYVGLFIATAISMQSKSFSYSRKLGTARANKLQIMLPVDDNDEPDYEFMEECGRKIMAKKYIQYLKYLESTCESSGLLLK